jgi:hypothetical protein
LVQNIDNLVCLLCKETYEDNNQVYKFFDIDHHDESNQLL